MNLKNRPLTRPLSLLALASTAALLAPAPALAQDNSYVYGGASFGQSTGNINAAGMAAYQTNGAVPPLGLNSLDRDRQDTAYRLFLGYQFNRNWGLEAGFFNLGKFNYHATTTPAGALDGEVKIQGASMDVVGTLPLSESFSLLARVGGQYAKTRNQFSDTGTLSVLNYERAPSDRQFNYKVGVGMQYAFGPNFLMRGEAEQYRTRDAVGGHARTQVYSLSVVVPFGAGARQRTALVPASYQPAAYAPPPMAAPAATRSPAPSPAPSTAPVARAEPLPTPPPPMAAAARPAAPVAAPTAAMPRSVSFTAESLFGFDVATIRPEGKTALDTFARDVAGTQFQVVVVEGHADRLGSEAYNQTLSLQRADAVKSYLVSSGGMDAAKITTKGMGESSPSQASECAAALPATQLRSCLQPDRRVDVGVTGTR